MLETIFGAIHDGIMTILLLGGIGVASAIGWEIIRYARARRIGRRRAQSNEVATYPEPKRKEVKEP